MTARAIPAEGIRRPGGNGAFGFSLMGLLYQMNARVTSFPGERRDLANSLKKPPP
jgi:hypothetical protein